MHFVVGFQFSQDLARLALVKKNRPVWQAGLWNGIGGHVERDETPSEAMVREYAEETGVPQGGIAWRPFANLVTWTGNLVSFFLSRTDQVELVSTQDEEVRVFDLSSLPMERLVPNVPWLTALALSTLTERVGGNGRKPSDMYVITEVSPSSFEGRA